MEPDRPKQTTDQHNGRLGGWAQKIQAQKDHPLVRRTQAFYGRHQRLFPPLFFFGGVVWDLLTLDRIDSWADNLILLAYLIILGGLIIVATIFEYEGVIPEKLARFRSWLPHTIQFFLGALFSAYVIFYFQSTTLAETALFFGLLVVLLVANEFIHQRLFNLYLIFALYFLACFSFFIFFVPVVTKQMSYQMFVLGGLLSMGVVGSMLIYLKTRNVFARLRQFVFALGLIGVFFGLLNLFYLQHWIPPVPLAMRHGGIFHYAENKGEVFDLRFEQPAWYEFWIDSNKQFHYTQGDTVFAFAAIFAPTELKKTIYHHWQVFDEQQQAWLSTDRIGYEVVGGRFNGYRGFTRKQRVRPGTWRVDVETDTGRIIGRIPFEIVPTNQPVTNLKQVLYE